MPFRIHIPEQNSTQRIGLAKDKIIVPDDIDQ